MISTRILILLCWLLCLLLKQTCRFSVQGQALEAGPRETPKALVNPGFEDGEVKQAPTGWPMEPHESTFQVVSLNILVKRRMFCENIAAPSS